MDTDNMVQGVVAAAVAPPPPPGEERVQGVAPLVGTAGIFPAAGVGVMAAAATPQLLPNVAADIAEDTVSQDGSSMRKTEIAKERNRVHARNTRARKKQYMEELKERVENMHAKKAADERRKETAAREEEEQIARWTGALRKVLELRCEGVVDKAVWGELLTEEFELSLPLTPYRAYDPADVEGGRRRVLVGVEGMIADVESLTEMCVKIAEQGRQPAGPGVSGSGSEEQPRPRVQLKAFVGSGDLVFSSGEGIMSVFSMTTVDACDFGSPLEVEQNGMLRAAFDENGKLDELELMFDGVAVHQQLQKAMGRIPGEGEQSKCDVGQPSASVPDEVSVDEGQCGGAALRSEEEAGKVGIAP